MMCAMSDTLQFSPNDSRLTLRVPQATLDRIDRLAAHAGHRSRSQFVRDAVDLADTTMQLAALRPTEPADLPLEERRALLHRRDRIEEALLPKPIL